jgi:sugar lactone lactonase YvrE
MSYRNTRLVLAAVITSVAVAWMSASTPVLWQVSTRADLLKGNVEDLSIDNDGRLSLGPPTSLVYDSAAPFLWCLVPGSDGSVIVGSGNEGKVFRVDKDGKSTTLYDTSQLEIHALAAAPSGEIYAAASPDGQIYRIDAKGTATPFFNPEDKYIWSLAVDTAGNVFAGTGEKGVIYKITPDGKGSVFYKTRSTNVVALNFDKAGNLLAGTESPGRVFRIDRDAKAFVLLESSFREIHSLRVDDKGVIYAAAVAAKTGSSTDERPSEAVTAEPTRAVPMPSVTTEITGISIIDVGASVTADSKAPLTKIGPRGSKGAVYRILPDGLWDTIWESSDDTPYDVAFGADGGVLIATGNKGKIFRVVGDPPQVSLVGRAPAQQITRFLTMPTGDMLYVTSNPGKMFRLSPGRADHGTYESDVRDAQTVATWGTIGWSATTPPGARIELRTRSGNSQTPDETWSPWSEPCRNPGGQQIQSPKARYLQWQATLTGKDASPVLTSVTAAYLQRNLRPTVTSITVYPAGNVFQKPYSTGEAEIAGFDEGWPDTRPSPSALAAGSPGGISLGTNPLGRRIFQKGLQAFAWKAEDDNDDKLLYDVLYRREGETNWKTLKRGLTDQLFVWDTTSVPDGTYIVRIVASDSPSNPPGAALTGEADSTTFDIDNTPPTIRVTGIRREGGRTTISFEASDTQSIIQRMDYSIDATRWRPVYPKDGICDSRLEQFELVLDGAPSGVVLRAVDAMNNVATAHAGLAIKE